MFINRELNKDIDFNDDSNENENEIEIDNNLNEFEASSSETENTGDEAETRLSSDMSNIQSIDLSKIANKNKKNFLHKPQKVENQKKQKNQKNNLKKFADISIESLDLKARNLIQKRYFSVQVKHAFFFQISTLKSEFLKVKIP